MNLRFVSGLLPLKVEIVLEHRNLLATTGTRAVELKRLARVAKELRLLTAEFPYFMLVIIVVMSIADRTFSLIDSSACL
ncbi:hypothetical protein IQ270_25365 [Microcoleus sp. LEGE 07076]|uniref:hypothetical protein n=1 Tax=Microcoleus sp. LEGE 07076 TaxID=915322 RepID=UPI00187FB4D6|nr:hypothetical protein [Microcoleus sp. LEGE 07076]MBE9187878.1 hypothetical protein [Microcoleus sp. LEGE 07076]